MHPVKYRQRIPEGSINGVRADTAVTSALAFDHYRRLGNLVTQMMRVDQNLQVKGKLFYQHPRQNPAQYLGLKQLDAGLGIMAGQGE